MRARLYTYLQKSASVYNTTQQEEEKSNAALLQNKIKNILCVYFPVHFYTHTNKQRAGRAGRGQVGAMSLVMGYNGDTIWVTYSGEKASKPAEGIKALTVLLVFSVGGGF